MSWEDLWLLGREWAVRQGDRRPSCRGRCEDDVGVDDWGGDWFEEWRRGRSPGWGWASWGCGARGEQFGRPRAETVFKPADFEVGGHCGTRLEDSSRQLVWGPGLAGEGWAGAKDSGNLIVESRPLKPQRQHGCPGASSAGREPGIRLRSASPVASFTSHVSVGRQGWQSCSYLRSSPPPALAWQDPLTSLLVYPQCGDSVDLSPQPRHGQGRISSPVL